MLMCLINQPNVFAKDSSTLFSRVIETHLFRLIKKEGGCQKIFMQVSKWQRLATYLMSVGKIFYHSMDANIAITLIKVN